MSGSGCGNPYRIPPENGPKVHWLTLNWKGVFATACFMFSVFGPAVWCVVNNPPPAPQPCIEKVSDLKVKGRIECVSGKAEIVGHYVHCICPEEKKNVSNAE